MLILWVIQVVVVVVVVVAVVVVVVVVVVIDVLVVVVLVDALAPILDTPGCGGTRSSTSSGTMRSRPPKPVHVAFPFMSFGEDVSLMFNCIFFAVNPPKPFSCGLLLLLCWSVCGRRRFSSCIRFSIEIHVCLLCFLPAKPVRLAKLLICDNTPPRPPIVPPAPCCSSPTTPPPGLRHCSLTTPPPPIFPSAVLLLLLLLLFPNNM